MKAVVASPGARRGLVMLTAMASAGATLSSVKVAAWPAIGDLEQLAGVARPDILPDHLDDERRC
jgi:hypothetical protein